MSASNGDGGPGAGLPGGESQAALPETDMRARAPVTDRAATDKAGIDKTDKESRPSPIDIHVGSRIRLRRTLMGMSQERLGEALGLTFQQVQKYERGVNRVGASRLFDLSRVLDVPISFFFDDMPEPLAQGHGPQNASLAGRRSLGFADTQDAFADDAFSRRETLELVRAYYRITDAAVRKRVFDLIKSLTPDAAEA